METKERRRAPDRRKKPAPTRRTAKKGVPDRRRRKAAAAAPKLPRPHKRVVRAPKEDIPSVVYTMPKPIQKGKLLLRLGTVVAVVVALMLAISIFFRVEKITVVGANKYSAWDIREASGIEIGDGLLTLSQARAAGNIENKLDYVDEVKFDIQLPGTVQIEITEILVTYAVETEDHEWWLIDSEGEAIEPIKASEAAGYTRLQGVTVRTPEKGETVSAVETAAQPQTQPTDETQTGETEDAIPPQSAVTNSQRLASGLEILRSLEKGGVLGEAAYVDVEDLTDIRLQYGDRFDVRLGNAERLDYKVSYMVAAITAEQMEYQIGVLDVSFEFSQEAIFTPSA